MFTASKFPNQTSRRPPGRRPFAGLLLFLALLAVLLACKKGPGKDCGYNKDCKDTLVCLGVGTGKCMELDQAKSQCAASEGCKKAGECGLGRYREAYDIGTCWATAEEHCKKSTDCASEGKCTFNPQLNYCMK